MSTPENTYSDEETVARREALLTKVLTTAPRTRERKSKRGAESQAK